MATKAVLMSLLDTALEAGMTVSERLKPIWQPLWQLLPSWLTGLIIWTLKWFLGLATMLALVLYRNQNAMLYQYIHQLRNIGHKVSATTQTGLALRKFVVDAAFKSHKEHQKHKLPKDR